VPARRASVSLRDGARWGSPAQLALVELHLGDVRSRREPAAGLAASPRAHGMSPTKDKDFGELAVREGRPHVGVDAAPFAR